MVAMEHRLQTSSNAVAANATNLRRQGRGLRFERGGNVYATDGRLGSLRQVVVDEETGRVTALVVTIDSLGEAVLLSPLAVRKTGGSAVFLDGTYRQFEEWLPQAPRYYPQRASRVNLKSLVRGVSSAPSDPRVKIVSAGKDFIETGTSQDAHDPNGQNS
jgi:hypothetical protein